MRLRPNKCEFHKKKVKFFGSIITTKGIKMDQEQVKTITKWLEPKNLKEVQAFLTIKMPVAACIAVASHVTCNRWVSILVVTWPTTVKLLFWWQLHHVTSQHSLHEVTWIVITHRLLQPARQLQLHHVTSWHSCHEMTKLSITHCSSALLCLWHPHHVI